MSEHKHVSTCKIVFLLACASLLDTGEIEVKGQGTIARSSLLLLGFVTCWLSCYSLPIPPYKTPLRHVPQLPMHASAMFYYIPFEFLVFSHSLLVSLARPLESVLASHNTRYPILTQYCVHRQNTISLLSQLPRSLPRSVSLCPHRSRPTDRHSGNSSLPDSEVRGAAASDDLLNTSLRQL